MLKMEDAMKKEIVTCPGCGSDARYYDRTKRIVRTKGRQSKRIYVERYRCYKCGETHRKLPDLIYPYKQYEREIITGVLEGFITPQTFGYEDYPCEMTMIRWRRSQNIQVLL